MQEFGLVAAAFLVLALAADTGRLTCGIDGCRTDPVHQTLGR